MKLASVELININYDGIKESIMFPGNVCSTCKMQPVLMIELTLISFLRWSASCFKASILWRSYLGLFSKFTFSLSATSATAPPGLSSLPLPPDTRASLDKSSSHHYQQSSTAETAAMFKINS